MKMLNAFGNMIHSDVIERKQINDLISQITNELSCIEDVQGILLYGSIIEHAIDYYTDIDLRIIFDATNIVTIKNNIYKAYKKLGATDDDFKSIHSPFDDFSFDNIYMETELYKFSDIKNKVNNVLSGEKTDDGLIYSIQQAKIIYDRQGEIFKFCQKIKDLQINEEVLELCFKKHEAVSLKLLYHSFKRQDYPSAYHWLWRTFFDTTRILFSKNKMFFPATKRLLSHHVPKLKKIPSNYAEFWNKTFQYGVKDSNS